MLVLSRKVGESIVVGDRVLVTVTEIRSDGKVRLGITAPDDVSVDRLEIRRIKERERNGGTRP